MDPTTKDKLVTNIKASPKMLSMQVAAFFSAIGTAGLAYLATLTIDQQIALVTSILSHWGWGVAILPAVGFAIRFYARVKPQTNITPTEAAAKSNAGPISVDFPLPTGPAPLPTVPPHEG